jgi:hypothetical protein
MDVKLLLALAMAPLIVSGTRGDYMFRNTNAPVYQFMMSRHKKW